MDLWHPGAQLQSRYTLVAPRDDHGLGDAWTATDRVFGDRRVTVKCLRAVEGLSRIPRGLQRTLRGARGLRHPHRLPMLDEGVWASRPYVVYEHTAAPSLGARIDAQADAGPLPVGWMRQCFEGAAAAVMAGHAERSPQVHGLLCPATVLVFDGPDGPDAQVVDAGLLGELDFPAPVPGRARTASCLAPELHAGEAPTVLTDVFALGLVLLEMLADRGSTLDGIAGYRRRADVPEALWSVVLRVTRAQPSARLSSVEKLLAVLAPAWEAPVVRVSKAPPAGGVGPSLRQSVAPSLPAAEGLVLPALSASPEACPDARANRDSLTRPLRAEHLAAVMEYLPEPEPDPEPDPEPTLLDATALLSGGDIHRTLNPDELALLTRVFARESEVTLDLSSTFQLNADVEALARAAEAHRLRLAAEEGADPSPDPSPDPPREAPRAPAAPAPPAQTQVPPWAWVALGATGVVAVTLVTLLLRR